MTRPKEFRSPQDIAAALRRIADRLEALPEVEVASTRAEVTLWVDDHTFDAETGQSTTTDADDLRQTADLLGYALTGHTGADIDGHGRFYLTPRWSHRHGVKVDVAASLARVTPAEVA